MIDKPLEEITYANIDEFVQGKWPEGKTVDYKRDSYGGRDEDKRELLKDVSSFANTQGGDILIGVDEDKGIPTGIHGIVISDPDGEKLRLEGIIRQGLEPRIEFGIHHVSTPTGTSVLILRIKESLLFPHRVVFRGKFGEFWGRSSAGKFSMDTDELRQAFTLSDSIYEQIRLFRQKRVAQVMNDETPIPLMPGGRLLLHLVPVSSFRSRQQFDVASMQDLATQFPPLGTGGWSHRLNLDGHVQEERKRIEAEQRRVEILSSPEGKEAEAKRKAAIAADPLHRQHIVDQNSILTRVRFDAAPAKNWRHAERLKSDFHDHCRSYVRTLGVDHQKEIEKTGDLVSTILQHALARINGYYQQDDLAAPDQLQAAIDVAIHEVEPRMPLLFAEEASEVQYA